VSTPGTIVHRHALSVRLCHWINVVSVGFLAVSGMAILLDYPELYWGQVGFKGHEPAFRLADWGITMEGNRWWGRNTHFLFTWIFTINGVICLALNLLRRRTRGKLLLRRDELRLGHLAGEIKDHLRLRTPKGEAARHYGTVQKLTYLTVLLVLAPLMFLSGLAQSPAVVAACPELLDLFGGKQSARSIHFIGTVLLLLFVCVHLFQIFLAGAVNEIRSMITGRFVLPESKE
jgi:thiosulfate reductase cytochrome b subunit